MDLLEQLNVNLPRWSQMLVWGKPVTRLQARDIINRTDPFFYTLGEYAGGNNHDWNQWARETLGIAAVRELLATANRTERWTLESRIMAQVAQEMGFVRTQYVTSNWASCSFVHGPHGWCHPDGTIAYVDNVGKYPYTTALYEDWRELARAFPFLDLTVTLMDGEGCEADIRPLISFRVREGSVAVLLTPVMPEPQEDVRERIDRSITNAFVRLNGNVRAEQGLPDSWVVELGQLMAPKYLKAYHHAVRTPQNPD